MAEYVRLRAPREHGETLQIPSISNGADLARSNRDILSGYSADLQQTRTLARKEIKALASEYSRRYLSNELASNPSSDLIVMSGHQPTLFHPGVWFKNFALDSIAKIAGATAINLVVDNDLCEDVRLRVPAIEDGNVNSARVVSVAIDGPAAPMPFEMRRVEDPGVLSGFPSALQRHLNGWPINQESLVSQLWPELLASAEQLAMLHFQPRPVGIGWK